MLYNDDGSIVKTSFLNGKRHGMSLTTHYDGSTDKV